jgi:deoxyribonuclease-4
MSGAPRAAQPFIGAHMSIAGGLHNAILEAARHRCRALQIFSKTSNQWRAKALADEDVRLWKTTLREHPMHAVVHDSYLINLASPDPVLSGRSREAFLDEVTRCDRLGIGEIIFHPGAHMGAGEEQGLRRIADSLDWVCDRSQDSATRLVLETTAGQGTTLGYRLEQLAWIIGNVRRPQRLGVCIDTCHILAAGYDFRTPKGYEEVFEEFERILGFDRLCCFHLNDSKRELGSRVDRHEHIGKGHVGTKAFGFLMRDPRFVDVPKIIETPKKDDMDRKNLSLLRRLAHMKAPPEIVSA